MNNMAVCNYIVSLIGAAVGASIMGASAQFPMEFTQNGPGPGFWPFALGTMLTGTAVFLFIYTLMQKEALSQQTVRLTTVANKRVYVMMLLVVAFCVLVNVLGFYIAAALMIPCIMLLMDYHDKKFIALTTVCTVAFIYLVFGLLLRTQMPQSMFM